MKQQILVVSHCFLNDAAKLKNQNQADMAEERDLKRAFLKQMLSQGIELLQLPCPEFLIYGSNRWGHAASQFDTPHFRRESRRMLEPVVMQLEEYSAYPDRYEVLGILGIDGSPSCGVNFTYDGDWGGELSGNPQLARTLDGLDKVPRQGIFMDILKEMLHEKHLPIKLYSLETFASVSGGSVRRDASQVDLSLNGQPGKKVPAASSGSDIPGGISLL